MYAEHSIEPENCIQLTYEKKKEHFVTPNKPKGGYPRQIIKVNIFRGSSDTTMIQETKQLSFNLDLEYSKDKARNIVHNIGRAIVVKKTLSLGSKKLEVIENSDIFDVYKDLYLMKKQWGNMHLQGIQAENGLKGRSGC